MTASSIAGYTYRADILCPGCTLVAVSGNSTAAVEFEFNLDAIDNWLRSTAAERGIDFDNEQAYDSGEYPKVILTHQAGNDRCGHCGEALLG